MIAETLIREVCFPPKPEAVSVRPYTRKKPSNPKRERLHAALRQAVQG